MKYSGYVITNNIIVTTQKQMIQLKIKLFTPKNAKSSFLARLVVVFKKSNLLVTWNWKKSRLIVSSKFWAQIQPEPSSNPAYKVRLDLQLYGTDENIDVVLSI